MKFTAFLNKVSTEEVTIEADTRSKAMTELRKLIKDRIGASSAVLAFAMTDAKGDTDFEYAVRLQQTEGLTASKVPKPTTKAMHAYFLDELTKSLSVIEALAHCATTDDLVIDRESDVDEVLASRDFQEEYDTFMSYILFARRSMNLPDVLSEPGEEDQG
nr:hypothetical protein RKHAN_00220 [Rhizobium sp. Khangiran2]